MCDCQGIQGGICQLRREEKGEGGREGKRRGSKGGKRGWRERGRGRREE